jgi:hypothetical protein
MGFELETSGFDNMLSYYAPTSCSQKLNLMGKRRQSTYTSTLTDQLSMPRVDIPVVVAAPDVSTNMSASVGATISLNGDSSTFISPSTVFCTAGSTFLRTKRLVSTLQITSS